MKKLLEEGLARVYRFNNELFDRLGDYLNAEDTAKTGVACGRVR